MLSGTILHNSDLAASLYRSKIKCISTKNKIHLCGVCGKKFNYFDKLHSLIRLDHQLQNLYILCYNRSNKFAGSVMQAFQPIICHKKCAENTIQDFSQKTMSNLKFASASISFNKSI